MNREKRAERKRLKRRHLHDAAESGDAAARAKLTAEANRKKAARQLAIEQQLGHSGYNDRWSAEEKGGEDFLSYFTEDVINARDLAESGGMVHGFAWFCLGWSGGGAVGRQWHSASQCFTNAIECEDVSDHRDFPGTAGWHRVFRHPGHRTLSTECQDKRRHYGVSGKDCVHCNRYDKLATSAWYYLGVGGGGVVGGQEYSESQCMLKALAFDDTNSDAWCNLGFGGGGDVGGQHYSQSQCYVRGCSFGEMCGPTEKASWPTSWEQGRRNWAMHEYEHKMEWHIIRQRFQPPSLHFSSVCTKLKAATEKMTVGDQDLLKRALRYNPYPSIICSLMRRYL